MIQKAEVERWLESPVTKTLIECFEEIRREIEEDLGAGSARPPEGSTYTLGEMYQDRVARVSFIGGIVDGPGIMGIFSRQGKLEGEE